MVGCIQTTNFWNEGQRKIVASRRHVFFVYSRDMRKSETSSNKSVYFREIDYPIRVRM